ncbi:MAG: hemolysin family protein [Bryobacteraceae bacterium]
MVEAYLGYRYILLFFILAANGFFAAAEVALISSRSGLLRQMAQRGNVGASTALSLLAKPERLLSVAQVGVTLASLGLGWAGEETVYQSILALLHPVLTPVSAHILHGASFLVAFLAITFVHVVIGEVVPKNLALQRAERLAMLVAPPLLVFSRITAPFVFVIEHSAAVMSRLLGLKQGTRGGGHSAEDLRFIISSSRREGHLETWEESVIQRVLDMGGLAVREIMVPRNDVVSISIDSTLEQALDVFVTHEFSRVPVYEKQPHEIAGIVHYKDLLRDWRRRNFAARLGRPLLPFRLRTLVRRAIVVPESKLLDQMVDLFRESHTHMAMVVDEFGTIVGIVTLEDVLEQMFGEIEDEHDQRRPAPSAAARVIDLDGATPIRDLEMQYGITLPAEAGFETLAGFLLYELGHIPEPGECVEYEGMRFTVVEMEHNRIARVRLERGPAAAANQ